MVVAFGFDESTDDDNDDDDDVRNASEAAAAFWRHDGRNRSDIPDAFLH